MDQFTLRVELLGALSEEAYKNLHARMQAGGFLQAVTGIDAAGQAASSSLPHATYYGSMEGTAAAVRDWAQGQARAAWGSHVVFAAETSSWARGSQ